MKDTIVGILILIYIGVCVTLFMPKKIDIYHTDRSEKILKKSHVRIDSEDKYLFTINIVENKEITESVSEKTYNQYKEGQIYHTYDVTLLFGIIAIICFTILAIATSYNCYYLFYYFDAL